MVEGRDLHIVRMGEHHLSEVFSLIDRENWGWEFTEIQQIHRLDQASSVVALDGRDMVGLVTCVDFGAVAFIVHVIVKKGWRRKGVGVRMMGEVLAGLDSRGVPTVELHANPEAVRFYDQFSFRRVEDVSFYSKDPPHEPGPSADGQESFEQMPPGDLEGVSEALSRATGYPEPDIDNAIRRIPPDLVLARREGGRATALLLSRTAVKLNAAGPWFMDRPDRASAGAMMHMLLSRVPAKRVDIMAPVSNEVAAAVVSSCGFTVAKAGIVRLSRSSGPVRPFSDSVLMSGHLGPV